jgi:hypothetical protein
MLDRLRVAFPYILAFFLPLAGAVIAILRFTEGDRDDALRIAAVSLLGLFLLYGLVLGFI